ncbi:MAG: AAA family ATPase [Pseudomonadota bacterium]|nr:AAA family ATPase [Pseudomonadota bacterium]
MLKSLKIKNFTLFSNNDLEFVPGLNVIMGDNATGKSHLLKLLYTISSTLDKSTEKKEFARVLTDKLNKVFRQDIKHLRSTNAGQDKTDIELNFTLDKTQFMTLQFSYTYNTQKYVKLEKIPSKLFDISTLFIPAHEVLSLHPWLISLYEKKEISLSELYYDLCLKLLSPSLKKLDEPLASIKTDLETLIGGQVRTDERGLFIMSEKKGELRPGLIADGPSKLAGLIQLIDNGSLHQNSIVFWDEVDAHLNPKALVEIAKVLMILVQYGLQIFISTHSFFLMKELSNLTLYEDKYSDSSIQFFNLSFDGQLEIGDKLTDLHNIQSLEEILTQDDREQFWFYQQAIKQNGK